MILYRAACDKSPVQAHLWARLLLPRPHSIHQVQPTHHRRRDDLILHRHSKHLKAVLKQLVFVQESLYCINSASY